jgi:hypothetical protein
MKKIIKNLQFNKNQIISYASILLFLLIIIFLFLDLVRMVVTVSMFILLNVLLRFYRRILPGIPLEFEIIIFGSLLTTIAFNIWAGFFVAFFGSVLAEFLNQQISPYSFINIFCYMLVPIIAIFIPTTSIAISGIIVMIILNIIIFIAFLLLGYDLFKNVAFAATNIFWNYLLFKYLANIVLKLII